MLIGKKILPKKSAEGKFYCPECRSTTGYEMKEKRKSFYLLWIPVLTLETVGKYIECVECRNSFRKSVLESSPETARAEFHPSMKRVMIMMLLADGCIDEKEIEIIKGIYARVSGYALTDDEIREEIETALKENLKIKEYLKKVTPYLNKTGKARVLKSAYYVASADGEFHDSELSFMEEVSHALEMEPAHYKSILDSIKKNDFDPSDPIPGI